MANSIASAVRYINNDAELNKIFLSVAHTGDFTKPNVAVGAKTVKYRQVSLGSAEIGTFNRATGYTAMDVSSTWVEKTLTQDKGNSLGIDKMDSEEAQALEITGIHNKYLKEKEIPYVDKYSLSAWAGTTGVHTEQSASSTADVSKDTILKEIKKGLKYLYDLNVTAGVEVVISSSAYALLDEANEGKGQITEGEWNGELGKKVQVINGLVTAKLKVIPDTLMPTKVNFIVAPVSALTVMVKYQENVYFDKIPGFGGRRQQVDSGIYFDAWVEPGAEKAVYVRKSA